MTRGTLYLVKNGVVVKSCEFNGDMYGSPLDDKESQKEGHYAEAVKMLKGVSGEWSFKKGVKEFDRQAGFNYQDKKNDYFGFSEKTLEDYGNDGVIDMDREKYFERFFSDYLFFKNVGKKVVFRDIKGALCELQAGDIMTFDFGRFIEVVGVNAHRARRVE